jgi:four helix bundle protein
MMEVWNTGRMSDGPQRRNKNRGYQQLRVWQDAVELYVLVCRTFKGWPFELKKVASQEIASTDSVHRNIAEGYARKSINEYLQFLSIARGSLAETGSGFIAYHKAGQLNDEQFESLDSLAFKTENGLLKLIESLERKRKAGDWDDTLAHD